MKLTFEKFREPEYNGNIYENFYDKENVYIVSEFCEGGDLLVKKKSVDFFFKYLQKVKVYQNIAESDSC